MSLYVLTTGVLIGDPQSREGAKGPFTTATVRANGDEAVLVSVIAFGDEAERLLEFVKGDALAVSGRARLTNWTGRDGIEKGLSLVAEQIAAAKPRPRSDRQRAESASPRQYGRPSARSFYSALPGHEAELAADCVDDLWARGES